MCLLKSSCNVNGLEIHQSGCVTSCFWNDLVLWHILKPCSVGDIGRHLLEVAYPIIYIFFILKTGIAGMLWSQHLLNLLWSHAVCSRSFPACVKSCPSVQIPQWLHCSAPWCALPSSSILSQISWHYTQCRFHLTARSLANYTCVFSSSQDRTVKKRSTVSHQVSNMRVYRLRCQRDELVMKWFLLQWIALSFAAWERYSCSELYLEFHEESVSLFCSLHGVVLKALWSSVQTTLLVFVLVVICALWFGRWMTDRQAEHSWGDF